MTATTETPHRPIATDAESVSIGTAFLALLARDFYVLRHNLK